MKELKKNFYCGDEVDYDDKCLEQCENCNDATGVDYGYLPEEETKCYCGHTIYCDCGPEDSKQETLEEAAKNYVDYCACNISENEDLADADKRGFIYGAKWQQERMYSEEEVYDIVQKAIEENSSKQLHFFDGGYSNPIYSNLKKWFETYKKK